MKSISLNNEKILLILKAKEDGTKITTICEKNNISRQTFYNLKKKFKGLSLSEINEVINLREELLKVKIELNKKELEIDILKDVIEKKF